MTNNEIMATIQSATTVILADYYCNDEDADRLIRRLHTLADTLYASSKFDRKNLVDCIKSNIKNESKKGYNNYKKNYNKLVNNK